METQNITLSELFSIVLFLGSVTFLIGTIYQIVILIWINSKVKWSKIFWIILLTRLLTIGITILLWKLIFQIKDVMFGPFLLPALIPEIVLSPLILKLMGFRILKKGLN